MSTEHESPIIVVSDGGPLQVTETSHEQVITRIREWLDALSATAAEAVSVSGLHDRYAMCAAAIALVETDRATGISLETFGPVGDLVSRVVAYAFGYDPQYTTVHWPVH